MKVIVNTSMDHNLKIWAKQNISNLSNFVEECIKEEQLKILAKKHKIEDLEKQINNKEFLKFLKLNNIDLLKKLYNDFLDMQSGN